MKKVHKKLPPVADSDMRDEYEIPANAVRGKYASRRKPDSYFVAIDPELRSAFPSADAVNEALHMLAKTAIRAVGTNN